MIVIIIIMIMRIIYIIYYISFLSGLFCVEAPTGTSRFPHQKLPLGRRIWRFLAKYPETDHDGAIRSISETQIGRLEI